MIANILLAVGLVMIVEGLAYALAPHLIERMLEAMRDLSLEARRYVGLLALVGGVLFVWLAQMIAH